VLASLAASRTDTLTAAGYSHLSALTGGYHVAFLVGAIFAASAATIGITLLRTSAQPGDPHAVEPAAEERTEIGVA
jgi:hypothetical protein